MLMLIHRRVLLQQFNQAALNDSAVKADMKVVQAIMGKQFVKELVTAGTVNVDEDGIHRVV